jgi:hypothetical protein
VTKETYVGEWATLETACVWLAEQTGQAWPLQRLLDIQPDMAVWYDPAPHESAELRQAVFGEHAVGYMAPLIWNDDIQRLKFVHETGTLTITRRPDGCLLRIDPPLVFPASELRICSKNLQRIADVELEKEPPDPSKLYGLASLKTICYPQSIKAAFEWHTLKDDGLWLNEELGRSLWGQPEYASVVWHPHQDHHKPALPLRFTVFDLAAFFLDGGGVLLSTRFDFQEAGVLDEAALASLGPNARVEVQLLRETYLLKAQARERFGLGKEGATAQQCAEAAAWLLAKKGADRDDGVKESAKWLLSGTPDELASPSEPAPAKTDELDVLQLATPEQLIDAFGHFTGMKKAWFNKLADTPALKRARRKPGKSGRGGYPALFDTYAVMCWLIDGQRRKGHKLTAEKAWELLERHFPNVHARNSAADPN